MIRLFRLYTPIQLTPAFVKEKTDEFKATGNSVWNIDWLKDSLSGLSHNKCAYCECALNKESNYMEVEHFEDKENNPEKVMCWDNLLPSCKHCNGHKSTHNVLKEPIVNPFEDDPHNHLYFHLYRYKAKDIKGQKTIDTLLLNDDERNLVRVRFDIGNGLEKLVELLKERYEAFVQNGTIVRRNKMVSLLLQILKQCQPDGEYSALCATVLHSNNDYLSIKAELQKNGLWSQEMEHMDVVSRSLCLFR